MNREQTLQAVLHITKLPPVIAEKITDDFINFNPLQKSTSLSEIEKAFNKASNPGFDAFSFRQVILNHYGLDKKTSSIVANSFRSRAGCMRSLSVSKDSGYSRCQWEFRVTCISVNRDAHEKYSKEYFLIKEGLKMPHGITMPGIEFGCNCDVRIVIEEPQPVQKTSKRWLSRLMDIFLRK
ncbi:hypothetical protein SRABI106_00438 [Rahnella aquatilis]|nr:hypothetical protein SRABI106_00438 [Rahnella aquatilis]